ncbi:TPA: hypothetical protein ACOD0T_000543 [Staphylococcus aureus]|nr:hypothetical protein [Staphylococcus aureus]
MKKVLPLAGIIIFSIVMFLAYSFHELNKKEYYYGFVDNNREVDALKDKTGDTVKGYNLIKDDKNIEKNKWVKVTYTDKKGVVLEQKNIDKNEVPKEIKSQFMN